MKRYLWVLLAEGLVLASPGPAAHIAFAQTVSRVSLHWAPKGRTAAGAGASGSALARAGLGFYGAVKLVPTFKAPLSGTAHGAPTPVVSAVFSAGPPVVMPGLAPPMEVVSSEKTSLAAPGVSAQGAPLSDTLFRKGFRLRKLPTPVTSPDDSTHGSRAKYNPSVIFDESRGRFLRVYRSEGGDEKPGRIYLDESTDGLHWENPRLIIDASDEYDHAGAEDPHIIKTGGVYYVNYQGNTARGSGICLSSSKDLKTWNKHGVIFKSEPGRWNSYQVKAAAITDRRIEVVHRGDKVRKYVMYYLGEKEPWKGAGIGVAYAESIEGPWEDATPEGPVMRPRDGRFDDMGVEPGAVLVDEEGILLFYNAWNLKPGADDPHAWERHAGGAALFSLDDPTKLLRRTPGPLVEPTLDWERTRSVNGKTEDFQVVFIEGAVKVRSRGKDWLLAYYGAADRHIGLAYWDRPSEKTGAAVEVELFALPTDESDAVTVGVDIGGTRVRVGFTSEDRLGHRRVVHHLSEDIPKGEDGTVGVHDAVAAASRLARQGTKDLEALGWSVSKTVGVSAPGAYLPDGAVLEGTAPNIPGLSKIKLHETLSRALGKGWTVRPSGVQNDGVVQGLAAARSYAASNTDFRNGKIMALVPGTGFGAGAYEVQGGGVVPMAGPQQFFDVVARKARPGEMIVVERPDGPKAVLARGGEALTMENLVTGKALGTLGTAALGLPVTGEELNDLAMEGDPKAVAVYRRMGADLAEFIIRIREGDYEKAVIPHKPDTKGTEVFLVGGWLDKGAGKAISMRTAGEILDSRGYGRIQIRFISDIPGMEHDSDKLGVLGASMLDRSDHRSPSAPAVVLPYENVEKKPRFFIELKRNALFAGKLIKTMFLDLADRLFRGGSK